MSGKKKNGTDTKEAVLTGADYAGMVCQCLTDRKYPKAVIEARHSEDDDAVVWLVPLQSVSVNIFIMGLTGDEPFLLIRATVASLPETGILPFYRRCLELNGNLQEGNLRADGKDIVLSTSRPLSCLNLAEAYYKVDMILEEAPYIVGELQSEFGTAVQPTA